MNQSASNSTITSTPSSQQSSNQNRPTTTTTSPPTNGMAAASKPTSIDSLLSTHGDASSPALAALEQAVNERNVLSSQNTQLWKLIEKQRSGYNQLLKDLERVRGERDLYKSKFIALGHGEKDKKRDSDREKKNLKHSHSTPLSVNDQGTSVAGESIDPEPSESCQHGYYSLFMFLDFARAIFSTHSSPCSYFSLTRTHGCSISQSAFQFPPNVITIYSCSLP
jgi:RalA-binding protein 1